jgi:hypothetical protein
MAKLPLKPSKASNDFMTRLTRFAVIPAFLLASCALATGATTETGTAPFAPGEKLTYSVTWSVFPAGEVTAEVQRAGDPGGGYQVVTTARSHGFVSLLYNLDDEFRTRFSPGTLCAESISKRVNEGRRRKQTEIVFDPARQMAVLDERNLSKPGEPPKHDEHPIPACVQDVVSAFYFLRAQPLHVGDRIMVPLNDGAATTDVSVEVQARELIDTPQGRRWAFRLEPTVFGKLYKRKGQMFIWLSDDEQRLPLQIKAMMAVGTITGTLQSVSEPPKIGAPSIPPASQGADGGRSSPTGQLSMDPVSSSTKGADPQ